LTVPPAAIVTFAVESFPWSSENPMSYASTEATDAGGGSP
jgi:hypothetical protein